MKMSQNIGNTWDSSNFFVKVTFSFMNKLIGKGMKSDLTAADFPLIEDADEAEKLSKALSDSWRHELQTKKDKASLVRVMIRIFGLHFFCVAGIVLLLSSVFKIIQGYSLGLLLLWFETSGPIGVGCLYAFYLCASIIATSFFNHVSFFLSMRVGVEMRVALSAAIYRKCMKLAVSNTSSTGMIVNLISNDVQRLEDVSPYLNYGFTGPLETLGMFYFMWVQIGWAAVAAVGGIFLLIPIQTLFANAFKKLRQKAVLVRDERIKSISDMLAGILVVKLYAWESPFMSKVNQLRTNELSIIAKASVLRAINSGLFYASTSYMDVCAFGTYYLLNTGPLLASQVFSVAAYLQFIRFTMMTMLPNALQYAGESLVSLKRIQEFLSLPEMGDAVDKTQEIQLLAKYDASSLAVLETASFTWDATSVDRIEVLKNISLQLRQGEIVGVCGPVGCGKSSLVNALLGEMQMTGGYRALRTHKIGYASQTPWILSGSIKDNITFGLEFNSEHFNGVVEACALDRDIERFPEGFETLIGERGVTLSGGQRARLALARALYLDADIYILDDPLSAVDTAVGRHLFQESLRKFLKNKAVLLITHQLQHIRACDVVVLLENGQITKTGAYDDVMMVDTPFAQTMREFAIKRDDDGDSDATCDSVDIDDADEPALDREATVHREAENDTAFNREISKEDSSVDSIGFTTYLRYFKFGSNYVLIVLIVGLLVLGEASRLLTDWWLAYWTNKTHSQDEPNLFLAVFVFLVVVTISVSLARSALFLLSCVRASENVFSTMVKSVFRSPMQFFQTNPHGRLMNRFSKDINLLDEILPRTIFDFVQSASMVFGTIVISAIVLPYVLFLLPFLTVIFYYLHRYFVKSVRQVKRLESITRSPIYAEVPSTLEGLSVIRAFKAESRFEQHFTDILNRNTRVSFAFLSANRWVGFRLDLLAATYLAIIVVAMVPLRHIVPLTPGNVGLMLSYLLQSIRNLQWTVRQSAEVETLMVSAERVLQYVDLPSEAADETDVKPRPNWPEHGDVSINDMSLTYPTSQPNEKPAEPVLKNINIHFDAGLKIGVVGRTGAGKSSLLQALFRIVEPSPSGSIVIDGTNTSQLGLRDLRSRISIIPQEPFCFKGTLRFNLDPFSAYSDEQLWRVLEAVELKETVAAIDERLEAPVTENGSNWSVGERQLICLARAMLRRSKVIVMDEATSSVDIRTDQLIQKAIRTKDGLFSDATVITIAHRLNTVIDYDRILVLDYGCIVEYGEPRVLLNKKIGDSDAWFARMVNEMGDEAKQALIVIANANKP